MSISRRTVTSALLTAAAGIGFFGGPLAASAPKRRDSPIYLGGSFSKAVRGDIGTVTRDVGSVVQHMFQRAYTHPTLVSVSNTQGPFVNSSNPKAHHVTLQDNDLFEDRDYGKFAFQLAHELGHIYLGPLRTSGLHETLSVAVSLQALTELSKLWVVDPPYAHWKEDESIFRNYRTQHENLAVSSFPQEVTQAVHTANWDALQLYLRHKRPQQDANATDRDLNFLGAMALLQDNVPWEKFCDISNYTEPSPEQDPTYRSDLQVDINNIPSVLPALCRIGRGCSTNFMAAEFSTKPDPGNGFVYSDGGRWFWLVASERSVDVKSLLGERTPVNHYVELGK